MTLTADHFAGCILGLATGDAIGAPYEGGLLERRPTRRSSRRSLPGERSQVNAEDVAPVAFPPNGLAKPLAI